MSFGLWHRALAAWAVALALLLAGSLPVFAQDPDLPADATEGLPVTMAGFSDSGEFHLYVNEEQIATITFSWQPDGALESTSTITMAGSSVTSGIKIVPDSDGRFKTITMDSPVATIKMERDGAVIRRTIKEEVATINLKPGTVLFENMTPALISLAVLNYDQAKGGKQTFPLFIVPQIVMDASMERLETVERTVGPRDIEFTRYTYGLPGVDITVWVDGDTKLCLADVPAQHAAYVRAGYEALRQAPVSDEKLSAPEFEVVVERNVEAPMRDGLSLATDIYRPDAEGRFPVILVRTPYKKEMGELQARYYSRRGYAFAIQDCRGRFSSPGEWEPFVNDAADGYDTIEWLAGQPWSDGKVGMIGGSYLGWVQWWAAGQNPPHLVTIIPNVAPPDPFYNIPYEYGAFFLFGSIWWAAVLESEATADISGAAIIEVSNKKYGKLLDSLPVLDLDKAVLGKENRYWRKWIEHPYSDGYWESANFLDRLGDVKIPVFHQSGWFDGDGIGSKLNYLRMIESGHPNQKLILGPWGHTDQATRRIGDRDFGEAAIIDLQREYLRWLDYWLKGTDNGIMTEPLVKIFAMGSNRWLEGDVYPLPQTQFQKWYFSGDAKANTSKGDGRLTPREPPADSPADTYTYDPGSPTPNPDFYEEPEDENGKDSREPVSVEEKKKEIEAFHQKVTDSREDILVYTSEPFREPLTIAGPVSAVLYAASSARDTDWFVRLMEIDEEGKIFPLAEGKLRARYRKTMTEPKFVLPGDVYEYKVDMWQTGLTVPAGRRLRVEVASASFPMFSRNLNTGGHNETETEYVSAEQTIYHNKEYPSHVLLPVIPAEAPPAE